MSEFARVDAKGNVLQVVVAEQAFIDTGALGDPASFVECSGKKNRPYLGAKYDQKRGDFLPPKGPKGWALNEKTLQYEPPTQPPQDGKEHSWSEKDQDWVEIKDIITCPYPDEIEVQKVQKDEKPLPVK